MISIHAASRRNPKPDLAVLLVHEGQDLAALPYLDAPARAAAKADGFKGQKDKAFYLPQPAAKAKRLLLIGLGAQKDVDLEVLRRAGVSAARKARDLKISSMSLCLAETSKLVGDAQAQALAEGAWLGLYRFDRYKSKKDEAPDFKIELLAPSAQAQAKMQSSLAQAKIICEGVMKVRDLVNTPPNDFHPQAAVTTAREFQRLNKGLKLRVYDAAQLARMGAGGILGVGRGSTRPPVLIHLSYKPARARKKLALVGKGVTFDSGGLSIKTGSYMQDMKSDMAGGATVLAAVLAAARLKLPLEIHAVAPFVENMPSGGALKVDEVVKFMNGKTAEIMNTDAEGRVILADALVYASRLKPDFIIDFATLTGAAMVALGMNVTALMGDSKIMQALQAAGDQGGEAMWPLPMPKAYRSHIESRVADMKNTGNSGEAGTIAGAMFLKEFVDEKIPWVHCDIAGPSYLKKEEGLHPSGATGTPLRSLLAFLQSL